MIDSLSNRAGTPVIWGKSSKAQGTAKTAKSAMTDGFIERIKSYAKEDAKRGEYMSAGFTQMRLSHKLAIRFNYEDEYQKAKAMAEQMQLRKAG